MITAFTLENGALQQQEVDSLEDLSDSLIWVDLIAPTEEERLLVERAYGVELPINAEIKEIEASARYYKDEFGLHIHSFFLNLFTERPKNTTVAFTLFNGRLITIHDEELSSFRLYRMKARAPERNEIPLISSALDIIIGLHEASIEHTADVIENIYTALEIVSPHVLTVNATQADEALKAIPMDDVLGQITVQEDINGKARLALMDTRRSLTFFARGRLLSEEQAQLTTELIQDIESLTSHTNFLFDKVNFLLDAAMGKISLEQSRIIKIFSIASVVFLPPTLIASIYGMNFAFMPELNFKYSYPLSIGLMILSGIAPYLLFRKKGWL